MRAKHGLFSRDDGPSGRPDRLKTVTETQLYLGVAGSRRFCHAWRDRK